MKAFLHVVSAATAALVATATSAASASNLDIDPLDSYPTDVSITSPQGSVYSEFIFNSSYAMEISDSNFLVDAYYNSDGSLNAFNSVIITSALNTGYVIAGSDVYATLEWQASSGSNNATLDALSGNVLIALEFKLKFTGAWLGGSETCTTNAFTVTMGNSAAYVLPYTSLAGINYTHSTGYFLIVSNGFNIAGFPSGTTCTSAHQSDLTTNLSVGTVTNLSGMDINLGYPTYDIDGNKVFGT